MTRRVDKPWGYEEIWAETPAYVGKVLVVRKGHRLSLQYHERKEETLYVESGRIRCGTGAAGDEIRERILGPGDVVHVPPGTRHRFEALEDTRLFEVSTPELEDVVRLADDYGRQGG
jgi:mannose-6-phosphate isomerase-like protein (cupin superfamily)